MEIKIDFSDVTYGEKLAKRLLEITSGISVVGSESSEFDILLTDSRENMAGEKTVFLSEQMTDPVSLYSSTAAVKDYVISVYERNTGKSFRLQKRKYKTISFHSEFGGSGCTSVSLTYSRFLVLDGKKTVFVTRDNPYIPEGKKRKANCLKLNYRLHMEKGDSIAPFLEEDIYGLNILTVTDFSQIERLTAGIVALNLFDYIVIDYGTDKPVTGDLNLNIRSCLDIRYRVTEASDEPVIENNCSSKDLFSIPRDSDAFSINGKTIDIISDTEFGRAVSRIVKETIDEQTK